MPTVTTLAELSSYLAAATINESLRLTPDMELGSQLKSFLATVPNQVITLNQPNNQLNQASTALTLQGASSEQWPIPGTDNQRLTVTFVTIVFTQPAQDFVVSLTAQASMLVGTSTAYLAGTLQPNNQLIWNMTSAQPATLDLVTIANVISHNRLAAYLPIDIPIFQLVPLSGLNLTFGFRRGPVTTLTASSDINQPWTIIENLAVIEQVGVSLVSQTSYVDGLGLQSSLGGNIHGTFVLGQPYQVIVSLRGQNAWELAIIPADGNVVPGLIELAGFAGGPSLQASVQQGLDALGMSAIALDQVAIGFDPYALALRSIGMFGHVTLNGITFDIKVFLPNFAFYGGLNPTTPIDLKALVTIYFADPDTFPAISLTTLNISAQPNIERYDLKAGITTDWTMDVGSISFGMRTFDLWISYQTGAILGGVECSLILVDVEFDAKAEHQTVDGGWQFSGTTPPDQIMPIGQFIQSVATMFGVEATLPAPIAGLTLQAINVFFDTSSQDFSFSCEAKFPIDDQTLDMIIHIDLLYAGNSYTRQLSANIVIGNLIFTLEFDSNPNSNLFIATYSHTSDQASISVKQLLGFVSTAVAAYIPESLTIDLKDVLFAYQQDTQTRFAFGFDLAASLNLSDLPLVGKAFPSNQTLAVQDLQVLITSLDFPAAVVTQLNTVLATQQILALPNPLVEGITVSALIDFGTSTQALSMPLAGDSSTVTPPTPPTSTTSVVTSNASAKWFDVKKGFGPVYFERIGVQYQDSALWFLLDASLTAAGLTLTVEGLGFGSPLNVFSPSFRIQGLGLDYRNAVVEIGGAFVHTLVSNQGKTYDEYDGMATLRVKQFNLGAIGSYAYLDDHPSLFVYAVLDFPLGGPAFFFVTGLSAGFGYNRSLIVPPIEQIASFPLVAEAISGPPSTVNSDPQQTIQTELALLRQYIPPSIGEMFLTAGIRFNSFRLIDSFALLTVSFGQHFEVDLLGLSTAIIPTPDLASTISPWPRFKWPWWRVSSPIRAFWVCEHNSHQRRICSRAVAI